MTDYPIQTGTNCVAYSYWVAMRIALKNSDKFRELSYNPAYIEYLISMRNVVGEPTLSTLRLKTRGFVFDLLPLGEDGMPPKVLPKLPIVVANQQYGYSNALCLLQGDTSAYDPGCGSLVVAELDKCSSHVAITCVNSEVFPYRA